MKAVEAKSSSCYRLNMNNYKTKKNFSAVTFKLALCLCLAAIFLFHNSIIEQNNFNVFEHDINLLHIETYKIMISMINNTDSIQEEADNFNKTLHEIMLTAKKEDFLNKTVSEQTDLNKVAADFLSKVSAIAIGTDNFEKLKLKQNIEEKIEEVHQNAKNSFTRRIKMTAKAGYAILIAICLLMAVHYYFSFTPLRDRLKKLINDKDKAMRTMREMSHRDPLTNLPGRTKFYEESQREISAVDRYGTDLSILKLDINGFKEINQTHGQQVGDKILSELSRLLRKNLRRIDSLYRLSGDKFIILAPHTSGTNAHNLADKLGQIIAQNDFTGKINITANFGIAHCQPGDDSDALLKRVDSALITSKQNGPGNISFSIDT